MLIIAGMVMLPIVISTDALVSGFTGSCIGFGIFCILFLIAPSKVGAGDVKLAGLIGFIVGFPMVFLSIALTMIISGIGCMFMVSLKRYQTSGSIPYAPFLCTGAIVTLWAGDLMVNWYWGLLV